MDPPDVEIITVVERKDPVAGWLLLVFALALVVFLTAGVSFLLYIVSMRDAPRTSVESSITSDEVAAAEDPGNVENWARLALSYAAAERWRDALAAIEKGREVEPAAILDLTEADILRLMGDDGAIEAYDRAIASGTIEYDDAVALLREDKGVTVPPPNVLVFQAMVGRALALDDAGRTEDAIAQALEALEIEPTDAGLRVELGDMYVELGRTEEARAEYEAALVYVPDLEAALEGLRRLDGEQ